MNLVRTGDFQNIFEVDSFKKEFLDVIDEPEAKDPPFPRYQKWLIQRLEVLEEYGQKVVQLEQFEDLKQSQIVKGIEYKIFSIRYPKSKLNPRVLFTFADGRVVILLCAFKEKSKSDYSRHISLAKNRIRQLFD